MGEILRHPPQHQVPHLEPRHHRPSATGRLGVDLEEVDLATKGLQNWKVPGNDSLPVQLLKIDDDDDEPTVLEHLHPILVEGDRSNCNNFRRISLISHVGKVPVKIITIRPSAFCDDTNNILPEKQCRFRPGRSTIDMLYMCFVDLRKTYDSVDRELRRKVPARAGVPKEMIAIIRKFHDGMRAWVRMDDGECSDWLKNLVYLAEETGWGAGTPLDQVRRAIWGMLNADDDSVVSGYAGGLARMMAVIVEVFGEFGPTVLENKTETLLMRFKEKQPTPPLPPSPLLIIEATGQRGKPEQNWQMRLKDDLKMFGA
ncbi:unnamed protein product [Ectocarpus sp. CCAP 1310/34]|nr:unnamed protein product [Ectocarpus sp. CCAP 1310/34]